MSDLGIPEDAVLRWWKVRFEYVEGGVLRESLEWRQAVSWLACVKEFEAVFPWRRVVTAVEVSS